MIEMNTYQAGDCVRLTATFVNTLGAVADPTVITCQFKLRFGLLTTYIYPASITKASTGIYYVDVTPTTEGIWDYRWVGTGAIKAAIEGAFNVPNSQFFP